MTMAVTGYCSYLIQHYLFPGVKKVYYMLSIPTAWGMSLLTIPGAVQQINVYTNSTNRGTRNIHGTPAYFMSPSGQEYIYVWAENGLLKQIPFNRTTMRFDTAKTILGQTRLPIGMPGAMLSVSSNQKNAGTGIVWAVHPLQGDANPRNRTRCITSF